MTDVFADALETLKEKGAVTFAVRVRPNSPQTKAKERLEDGSIKIDLAAVPEDGKANAELIRFLAEVFAVPRGNIDILSGATARRKTVCVRAS